MEHHLRNKPLSRIAIPVSPIERILDAAGAVFVLAAILIPLFSLQSLPASIPSHFGITGKPDAWSGTNLLFLLPAISLISFVLLTVVSRYPHLYNYPLAITEDNAERQYRLARMFIVVIKTLIAALFAWLEFQTIRVADGKTEGLGICSLPLFIALIFGAVIVYFIKAFHSR